jgi:hypothetical protein
MPLYAVVRLEANRMVRACPEEAIRAGMTVPDIEGSKRGADVVAPS